MPDLFKEIIPSILQTKQNVFADDPKYKDYVPFVVNKALAQHVDCIFYVNEMNINYSLDNDMQYAYYINSIRPYKRPFKKWYKPEIEENTKYIQEYFNCSYRRAKEMLPIITEAQISEIKEKINKGGVTK